MPDLLIELFSEEIPARMQNRAAGDLKKLVTDGLVEAGLSYESAGAFSTPRRLALTVEGLSSDSPDTREERKGPRTDAPQQAIAGFLRATGLKQDQLEIRPDKKGDVFFAVMERAGRSAEDIVAEVLETAIRNFPWPKSMRWGSGTLKWVRPLQSILCILNGEAGVQTVPVSIDGISSGDVTFGHRFMAPGPIKVSGFEDYAAKLAKANVVLSALDRADRIWADAQNLAFAQGMEVVEDRSLLAEVSGLVEWPVVLLGDIGDQYLELPPEVLQTSMREHQKFFSVRNSKSGRIEKFVTVANIETKDQGASILAGYQKVLAARLADADFFWKNDLRVATSGMKEWLVSLNDVTFHSKLGSQSDRIRRITALAREIATIVGADVQETATAAEIAKADLSSEMVYEFPELQGIMGRYYAEKAGYSDAVSLAVQEHYSPLGPSDTVPTAPVSVALALADKIDMLTGFWAINEKPTGSKDPFALRRAALGVIRLILENNMPGPVPKADNDLIAFIHDRLKTYLRDRGIRHDVIQACIAMPNSNELTLLVKRAQALADFLNTDAGENLLQGFKRANNILAQAEKNDGVEYSYGADEKFLKEPSEKELFAALQEQGAGVTAAIKAEDFSMAMTSLASMRQAIDRFFEAVQVNDENAVVRRNRLNLLGQIRKICLSVADLNCIESS